MGIVYLEVGETTHFDIDNFKVMDKGAEEKRI